jgi:type II secretory pathway component PulF
MPTFTYKAIQAGGTVVEGQIDAGGRQEAFRQMEAKGLRPVSLTEKQTIQKPGKAAKPASTPVASTPSASSSTPTPGQTQSAPVAGKVGSKMLENFTRLLSSLLAAGVPLSRALVILHKETSNAAAASKWKEIYDQVIDGSTLADAMARSPDTFPRVYVAMVQAGETGGFLDLVLAQIADFQSREKELRSRVMTAMLYPAILLFLAIAVLAVLMVFFIPKFQTVFEGFGGQLPLITRIIVGISDAIRSYGFFIIAGVTIIVMLIRGWAVSAQGRRTWEGIILKTPIIGTLTGQFAMARFCRMLGTLLNAGVPLVQGLNVARKSLGNQILVDAVATSIDRVKEGGQLGASLAECKGLFPGSVVEMISVAEESGKLDVELIRIANTTESDLDRQLKVAVSMAEPLLLFFIAAFIGTIFIGMLLPIFTMQDYMK